MVWIAGSTVGAGGVSTITFNSIPQTFTHLQIRFFVRSDRTTSNFEYIRVRFNSDTGANYGLHAVLGNGSITSSFAELSSTQVQSNRFAGNLSPGSIADTFGVSIFDVLDYTNTNKNTTIRNIGGVDFNGIGEVGMWSGLWLNTSAISRIDITPGGGTNFLQHSRFDLYGITTSSVTGA